MHTMPNGFTFIEWLQNTKRQHQEKKHDIFFNVDRILSVHLMAHFRMYPQFKAHTAAFRRGFRTVINPDLLLMFSAPEFQKLISGDNAALDIQDLRFVLPWCISVFLLSVFLKNTFEQYLIVKHVFP